jgi:hypothetical protein
MTFNFLGNDVEIGKTFINYINKWLPRLKARP